MGTAECGRVFWLLGASDGAVVSRPAGRERGFWAVVRLLKGSSFALRPPDPLRDRVGDGSTESNISLLFYVHLHQFFRRKW